MLKYYIVSPIWRRIHRWFFDECIFQDSVHEARVPPFIGEPARAPLRAQIAQMQLVLLEQAAIGLAAVQKDIGHLRRRIK